MRVNSIRFLASTGIAAQPCGHNGAFHRDAMAHVVRVLDTCMLRSATPSVLIEVVGDADVQKTMFKSVLPEPRYYEAILGLPHCCLTGDETVANL